MTELYIYVVSYYLYYDFIIPILKHNFYWCESSVSDSTVVYFTYAHWNTFTKEAGIYYVEREIFIGPLESENVKEINLKHISKVRCVVKNFEARSYRLISNLKVNRSCKKRLSNTKKIVDERIQNCLEFFKLLKSDNPDLLTNDLFAPKSIKEIKEFRDRMKELGWNKFYIVKADVKNCYESLRHLNLRCAFLNLISKINNAEILSMKVVLLNELNYFLNNIYLKFGNHYYQQICGVPQGSQISGFLCSIYMLNIKTKELFDFASDPNAILHQYVDDILFISPFQKEAESFLKHIMKIYPKYGLELNDSKIICSWTHQKPDMSYQVPWLGYNINEFCEIILKPNNHFKDLSRFAGYPRNAKHSFSCLKSKLFFVIKRRMIIMDKSHNEETIKCNSELLGKMFASIFICQCRVCLEPNEFMSIEFSQRIANLLKLNLHNYLGVYNYYQIALNSLKVALLPYKSQMKWILSHL